MFITRTVVNVILKENQVYSSSNQSDSRNHGTIPNEARGHSSSYSCNRKGDCCWIGSERICVGIITHDSNGLAARLPWRSFWIQARWFGSDQPMLEKGLISKEDWPNGWLFLKCRSHLRPTQIAQRMEQDEREWRREREGSPNCPYCPNKYSGSLCSSFTCIKPCQKWFNLQVGSPLDSRCRTYQSDSRWCWHLFILDGSFERYYRQNAQLFLAWFKRQERYLSWLKRRLK